MNPYQILKLDRDADKKAIIKATAQAMRAREFSAREIAIAQKTLLNQGKRVNNIFKHVDFSAVIDNFSITPPVKPITDCLDAPLKF